MRPEDISIMQKIFPQWKVVIHGINEIAILSAGSEETKLITSLFPSAWITELSEKEWNLFEPGKQSYDLIVSCNTFMYSSDPEIWFKNVLDKCRYFWIQDLIRSWRASYGECANGPDGDKDLMRFSMLPDYPARVEHAYDLNKLKEFTNIIDFIPYKTKGLPDKDALSFLMFLKGKLD